MYINTGQFGEEKDPEAKVAPGFLQQGSSAIKPSESKPPKVLDRRIKPEEKAKLISRQKFEPTNDETKFLKTSFLNQKYAWQSENLAKNLKDIQEQVSSTGLYADMLGQYLALSPSERESVHIWIKQHEKAIRQFKSGRDLEKKSEELKSVIALTNARIAYWKKLNDLKSRGIDIKGESVFKAVKPADGKRIESGVYDTPDEMPSFNEKPTKAPIKKAVKRAKRLMNLGEIDEGKILLSPFVPKDLKKDIVINTEDRMFSANAFSKNLPDDNHYFKMQEVVRDKTELNLKKSKKAVDNYWEKEKIRELQKEILTAKKREDALRSKIKELLSRIRKSGDEASKLDTTVIGILLEAKPERFVTSSSLIDGLKKVFSRLTPLKDKKIDKQAKDYLDKHAQTSESLLQELEAKNIKLAALRGEPIQAPLATPATEPSLGNFSWGGKKLNLMSLIPLLVAGFIIYRVYKGR